MPIVPSRRFLHRHRLKCVVLLAGGVLALHAIVLAWIQIDRQPDQTFVAPLVFDVSPAPSPEPARHQPHQPTSHAAPRPAAHPAQAKPQQPAATTPGEPAIEAAARPAASPETATVGTTSSNNDGGNAKAPPGPVASTGAVEAPSSRAAYLNNQPPDYPAISRRLGEQGSVVIRVLIGRDGQAKQAEVHQSSGFYRLDQAALNTVMGWRYVPGRRAGVAQDMWFKVPLTFTLD